MQKQAKQRISVIFSNSEEKEGNLEKNAKNEEKGNEGEQNQKPETGFRLGDKRGHCFGVNRLASYSPEFVFSAGRDATIKRWSLSSSGLLVLFVSPNLFWN